MWIKTLVWNKLTKWALGIAASLFLGWWFTSEKPSNLECRIISITDVYSINQSLSGLSIAYNGENFDADKLTLSFCLVRICNSGDRAITKDMYDSEMPFGLETDNGKILQPEIVSSSQPDYLNNKSINPQVQSDNKILFRNRILDGKSHYDLKFLIVHDRGSSVNIRAFGKIAGNQYIPVYKDFEKPPAPTFRQAIVRFWNSSNSPMYWTDVVVFICFLVIILSSLVLFLELAVKLFDIRRRSRIRKLIKFYGDCTNHEKNDYLDLLTAIYYDDSSAGMAFVQLLISQNYAGAIGYFSESLHLSGNSVYDALIKGKAIEDPTKNEVSQEFVASFTKYKAFIDSCHVNSVSELLKKLK
jgi:hypothetical protein